MKQRLTQLLFLFILGLPFFLITSLGHADEIADLQNQIDQRNANIKALEVEIAKYQAEADKTSNQAKTLANAIKALQQTGKKLDTNIKLTQAKISAANLTINKLDDTISEKEKNIDKGKKQLTESIRLMDQTEGFSPLQAFLQSKNLADIWDSLRSLIIVQNSIKDKVDNLQGTKKSLESDKVQTEEQKNSLKKFADSLTDEKKVIAANAAEQSDLLKETKNQESAYQSIVKQKQAAKAAFEKELFDYESKLKYKLNPSSLPTAGSSPFAWPTDDVYITQLFGKTAASGRLYAAGTHNGVDLKALMGTPIKALANGTVIGTGDTDASCPRASFGRWVLIKYSNGLSAIFGHLSVIKVSEGQSVSTGDVVAFSGNTGYSTGPHLHVSVYPADGVTVQDRPSISCKGKVLHMPIAAINAYLDPMLYFPKL